MDPSSPCPQNWGIAVISILEFVGSSRGGGAVHVRDLTRYLDPSRFAVTVAMPEDGGNVARADFAGYDIAFHSLDQAPALSLTPMLNLRRLLQERTCDILHCHGGRAALYGRLAAASLRARRPKTVYTIHGFAAPHYGLARRAILLTLERLLAPTTDAVIAVCAAERQAFLADVHVPPERMHVVRNGIDTTHFRDVAADVADQRSGLGVPSGSVLVTTVCRLYFPKDFDTLLRAFSSVRTQSPQAHLLIVGDGPYRPQVEGLIRELGLGSAVTLSGFRRDIREILAASDIFVLSTTSGEGLPLTILEAMASSLPVVASDVAGIGEAVIPEETGLLVPPSDPSALSAALLDIIAHTERAQSMGRQGRDRADASFTLERMGRETAAIYEQLVSRG